MMERNNYNWDGGKNPTGLPSLSVSHSLRLRSWSSSPRSRARGGPGYWGKARSRPGSGKSSPPEGGTTCTHTADGDCRWTGRARWTGGWGNMGSTKGNKSKNHATNQWKKTVELYRAKRERQNNNICKLIEHSPSPSRWPLTRHHKLWLIVTKHYESESRWFNLALCCGVKPLLWGVHTIIIMTIQVSKRKRWR